MKVDYSKYSKKFWFVLNKKSFVGSSVSVFVGRHNYPNIFFGLLSLPYSDKNSFYDYPEKWYKERLSIEKIVEIRSQLIYSRRKKGLDNNSKLLEIFQSVSKSRRPVDVEIELKKKPRFNFIIDRIHTLIPNPAPISKVELMENPKAEKRLEKVSSDYDLKARDAVIYLYKKIEISKIQQAFSSGILGRINERRLVPSRWSITAVDSIISNFLMKKVKEYETIDEILFFENEYLGNIYKIFLLPTFYQFELIEIWNSEFYSDYESYEGRREYAHNTHGAFYAAKLACLEYLEKVKKQAGILVVRKILPSYNLPVGIWQLRECIRDAFNKSSKILKKDDLEKELKGLSFSKVLRNFRFQNSIKNFL